MIRYHSFYAWHTANQYTYLMNEHDRKKLDWVRAFNPFDLYSRGTIGPTSRPITPYLPGSDRASSFRPSSPGR